MPDDRLRTLRAERIALERELAESGADKPPIVVTVRAMSTAEARKLLLEALEAG